MNDNVVDFANKLFQKKVSQNLAEFVDSLQELKDNPCLVQGLVPVIESILHGVGVFRDTDAWQAALYMQYRVGPDGQLKAIHMDFISDVALTGGQDNPPFMNVTASVGPEWIELISKPIGSFEPVDPDNVITELNTFTEIEGDEIINNFAFIEFGLAAALRDRGFTQYVINDPETLVTLLVSIKGEIAVVATIYNKVHHDDHLFLKNYGK